MSKRLTEKTIRAMRGQTELFIRIMDARGVKNIETIRRWVRQNEPDGPLTAIGTLSLISEATNVNLKNLTEDVITERERNSAVAC